MFDFDRAYDTYFTLAAPESDEPWQSHLWDEIAKLFDPFVHAARGRAAVRCSQLDTGTRKGIAFGKLSWKGESFRKWTHGSHQTLTSRWSMVGTEVWAPSWTVSVREGSPPDFFLGVTNERAGRAYATPPRFGATLVIALAVSEGDLLAADLRRSVLTLARRVSAPATGYRRRPWGRAAGTGFTDSIQDLSTNGLFRPGNPHRSALGPGTFDGHWELLDSAPTEAAALDARSAKNTNERSPLLDDG